MTHAERVVWAAAVMQAVAEAFDHIKANEAAWRKSMPGKRPVKDREILTRAIKAVEQSLGEHADVWPGMARYDEEVRTTKIYLATIGTANSNYLRRGLGDPEGRILHPESTVAQRKAKELKYG